MDEHLWDEISSDRQLLMDRQIYGSSYVKLTSDGDIVSWQRLDPRPFHGWNDAPCKHEWCSEVFGGTDGWRCRKCGTID